MHEKTDLGQLIVSRKRNLLKFISFTNYWAPEPPSENCILFLVPHESNLLLFLPFAGVSELAIDSPWTLKLKHNDAKIRAEIPLLTEQDER
jgi:hypothetical protein